jgi:uncharacterized membrane protein
MAAQSLHDPGGEANSCRWIPPSPNVQKIANIEAEQLHRRSLGERLGDRLVSFAGSGASAMVHFACFAAWVLVNGGLVPGVRAFDPYPFNFLTMTVSLEAIFITIAVLNSQNRMARQADRRAHLDLQVNLLAEQEATATLALLHRIANRLGVPAEESELAKLASETDVEHLVEELDHKLPS